MPDTTLIPDGDGTISGVTTTPLWSKVDEGVATSDDGTTKIDYGENESAFFTLGSTPSDYASAGATIKLRIRMRVTSTKNDAVGLSYMRLYESDESTFLSDSSGGQSPTTSFATYEFEVNKTGTNTKAVMDGARLRVVSNAGSDNVMEVSACEVLIEGYTAAGGGALLRHPSRMFMHNIGR